MDSNDSDDEESEDEGGETEETGSVVSSIMEDRLSIPKMKAGSWSDRRKRMLDRDGGLSSSLEGMSISPNISKIMGRG